MYIALYSCLTHSGIDYKYCEILPITVVSLGVVPIFRMSIEPGIQGIISLGKKMDQIGPSSGVLSEPDRKSNEEKKEESAVKPQTSSGDELEGMLVDRESSPLSGAGIGFMRQAPVLVLDEFDDDLEPERVAVKAENISQAGVLVHKVLAEDEPDSTQARMIQHGKFRCWEISRLNDSSFCLIHPQAVKGQMADLWKLAAEKKVQSMVDLSGQDAKSLFAGIPCLEVFDRAGIPESSDYPLRIHKVNDLLHYQLMGWADFKDASPEYFIAFAKYLLTMKCAEKLMVNCKAGLGRTGTFVQIFLMTEAAAGWELKRDNAFPWFLESIAHSRKDRGYNQFVQSPEQFAMLLKCLVHLTGVDERRLFSEANEWAIKRGWLLESE